MRFIDDYQYKSEGEKEQIIKKPDKKVPPKKPTKTDVRKFNEPINKEETDINRELFKKHFSFQMPGEMLKALYNTDNESNNNDLINMIKKGLNNLKDEIEKISEDEIKIKKPYEIVDSVQNILEFNRQNQEGKGLNIVTPEQIISRLPISLAQLKAGNNS